MNELVKKYLWISISGCLFMDPASAQTSAISIGPGQNTDITAYILANDNIVLGGGTYVVNIPSSGNGVTLAGNGSGIVGGDNNVASSTPVITYTGVISGTGQITVANTVNNTQPGLYSKLSGGALKITSDQTFTNAVGPLFVINPNTLLTVFGGSITPNASILNNGEIYSNKDGYVWTNISGSGNIYLENNDANEELLAGSNTINGNLLYLYGEYVNGGTILPSTLNIVSDDIEVIKAGGGGGNNFFGTYTPSKNTVINGNYYMDGPDTQEQGNGVLQFNGEGLLIVRNPLVAGVQGIYPASEANKYDYDYNGISYKKGRVFYITGNSETLLFGDGRNVISNNDGSGIYASTNNTFAQGNPYNQNFVIQSGEFIYSPPTQSQLESLATLALDYSGTYSFNIGVNFTSGNIDATGFGGSLVTDGSANLGPRKGDADSTIIGGENYSNFVLVTPPSGVNHMILTEPLYLQGITQVESNTILQLGDGTAGTPYGTTLTSTTNGVTGTYAYSSSGGNGMLVTLGNALPIYQDQALYQITNNGQIIVDNVPNAHDLIDANQAAHDFMVANELDNIAGSGGLVQMGTLTLTLEGNTTYAGATSVTNGSTLALKTNTATGATGLPNSVLSLQGTNVQGTGSVFDISQADASSAIAGLSGDAVSTIALGSQNLSINQNADSTFAGIITDGGISGGTGGTLTKLGSGTLTLTGNNTYTGSTTINGGTLTLGPSGSIARSSKVFLQQETTLIDTTTTQVNNDDYYGTNLTAAQIPTATEAPNNINNVTTTNTVTTVNLGSNVPAVAAPTTTIVIDNPSVQFNTETEATTTIVSTVQTATISSPALEIEGNQTIQDFGGSTGTSLILDSGSLLNFGASNSTEFDGVVTGSGNLNYQGNGTVFTLTGDSPNYTGLTTITSGTLQLGNGGTTGSIGGNVVDNGTLAFNRADDVTFNGTINGSGQLIEQGPGNLLLTANNPFTGTTTIAAGTLQLGNGGTSGNLGGNIVDSTALVFDRSDSVTYDGAISGAGTLSQTGSGTLVLDGNSTLTGGTTVVAGTLIIGDSTHSSTSIAGDVDVTNGATLSGNGLIGGNVTIANGAHLAPGDNIATLSIGGNLDVAQGGLLDYAFGQPNPVPTTPVTGHQARVAGNLTLNGAILNVTADAGFGAGLYTLFNYGGTLTESNGGIGFGTVPSNDSLSIQTLAGSKQINLLSVPTGALDFWNGNGLASSTQLGGGDGTWTLTAFNWSNAAGLTGPMQPIPSLAIFAGAPGTVTVDNSAGGVSATGLQFAVNGYLLTGDTLTLVADASGNGPSIRVGDGTTAGASDVAMVANVLAGTSGLVKTDDGILVLTGANTYTGGTNIDAGTLQLGNGGTTGTILGDIVDNGTLAIDRADALSFGQRISGSGGLNQLGSDTLTLTSANSYTGPTTISAGTLALNATGSVVDSSRVIDNSAFDISATTNGASIVSLAGNGTVNLGSQTLSLTAAADTFGGVIAGTGGLTVVSGTEILTGSNTYTGNTTISGGTLQLGNGGANGSVASNIADNGTLVFDRSDIATVNQAISGSGGVRQAGAGTTILTGNDNFTGGTIINAGTLQLGDGGTSGTIVGDVANNGTFAVDRADTLTLDQSISGTGGLIQLGSGTLTLTGANSYTGLTTISAGTLALSATGSIADSNSVVDNSAFDISATTNGASIVSLAGNGTVNLGSQTLSLTAAADTFGGVIAGTGGLTVVSGTEILTGSNTYTGNTTISGGTLQLGNGGANGSVASNIADNGTLVFDRSDIATVNQAISGSGGVRQAGAGTTILTGNDNFTGGTEVAHGDLQVDTSLSSDTVVDAGATLSGTGQVNGLTVNGNLLIGDAVATAKVFNAAHNVVFNPGSQFQVYVDPTGGRSLLQVAGSTVINGGNVNVTATSGSYGTNQSYEILQSAGGVSGTFNGVLINDISLAPTLQYQPNGVFLVLNAADTGGGGTAQPGGPQPIALFACAQLTANQCATEHALQAISLQPSAALIPVLNALVAQTLPQARVSLDALNGQLFADANMAALHQMSGLRALVDNRADQPNDDDLWFQAHNNDATLGNPSQTLSATLDDQGSYAGIQGTIVDTGMQLGAFVGDTRTNLNLSNGDHARLSTPQFGLYLTGVFGPNDIWYGNGSFAYGHPQVNTTRYVRVVDATGDTSVASYSQNVTALSLEFGYHGLFGQTHVDPFLAYDGAYVKHGVIDESSDQPSDLTVQGHSMISSLVSGGVHLSRDVSTDAGTIVPELTLAIARQQGDLQDSANAAFEAAPGAAFTTEGARTGRLLETVSGGLSAHLAHGWTASLDGTYTHALHESDRGMQAKLALSF